MNRYFTPFGVSIYLFKVIGYLPLCILKCEACLSKNASEKVNAVNCSRFSYKREDSE